MFPINGTVESFTKQRPIYSVPKFTPMNCRIMVITQPIPYYYERGSPLRVHMIIKGLTELGNEVHLVTTHLGEDVKLKGLRIYRTVNLFFLKELRLGFSFAQIYLILLLLVKAISVFRKVRPDIVIGVGFCLHFILKNLYKVPLILDIHNCSSQYYEGCSILKRIGEIIERFWYRRTDYIIANWEPTKEVVLNLYKTKRITVIHDRVAESISPARNISLPTTYVVYVGNFARYQGVELLIKAFCKARKFLPDFNLVLVGPSPPQSLRALAGEDNGVFFTGKLSVSEANRVLKDSMFAIIPRIAPGMPGTKLIQYIQFGKAILAVDISGNTLFLKNLESVLICKPEVDDLAEKMIFLARDNEFRHKLERNVERISERFSFEALKKDLIPVISGCLNLKR